MSKCVFISYGHSDNTVNGERCSLVANRLKNDLAQSGKYEVFFDNDVLDKGDWEELITKGIEKADYFLFLVSAKSTSSSSYCLNELSRACELKKEIIPVLLDDSFVPLSITRLQRIFFNRALSADNNIIESVYNDSYERLTRVLDGIEELGFFNKDFDVTNNIQAYDSYEIAGHIKDFCGRESLFSKFNDWISEKNTNSICMLVAAPGVGKSAISSMLTVKFPQNIAGIHFCNFSNSEKNNVKNIIKNLAYQLAYRNSEFMEKLSNSLKRNTSLDQLDDSRVFEILLLEPANSVTFNETQVLIIDGLDEAIVNNTNKIAELIVSFQTRLPSWLRFFCTSRPRKEVTSFFVGLYTIDINEFEADNTDDIKKYYQSNLNNISNENLELLLEKTHGSFLYAKTVMANIKNNMLSVDCIESFPDGIYSYYTLWFNRIFDNTDILLTDAKKILSLVSVCNAAVSRDFLLAATKINDVDKILEALSSFFPLVSNYVVPRHKSIVDWLLSPENCPSKYLIKKNDAYELLYNYIVEKRSARGWKKDPYVLKNYAVSLRNLSKHDELCDLLKDKEFHVACAKSPWFSVYETFFEYLDNLKFLYDYDEDYAFEVYDSEYFIEVFSQHRMDLYNAGLFIKLKNCGFSDYLKENHNQDLGLEYEFGQLHYYYISLSFKEAGNQIDFIHEKYDVEQMDLEYRSELRRMMMLVYRKLVEFGKLEQISSSTIDDAQKSRSKFEESLAYLTLSKTYCRELRKEEFYKANEEAIRILKEKISEDQDEATKLSDTLFLAEDYRVFADALIWHKDFEKAEEMLRNAYAIYIKHNTHDRYYQRFLYTTLFYEIVVNNDREKIQKLFNEIAGVMKYANDLYDEAQIAFFKGVYYYKNYSLTQDVSLLEEAKESLFVAIKNNKAIAVELERLEAETLYNLCEQKLGNPPIYNNRFNSYSDTWIEYVKQYMEEL